MPKVRTHRIVECCATSARLARAYLHAAKHNRSLARLSGIQELGQVVAMHDLGKCSDEFQMVVLYQPDYDHLVLLDSRAKSNVVGALHLLFTGPATHPDKVASG